MPTLSGQLPCYYVPSLSINVTRQKIYITTSGTSAHISLDSTLMIQAKLYTVVRSALYFGIHRSSKKELDCVKAKLSF